MTNDQERSISGKAKINRTTEKEVNMTTALSGTPTRSIGPAHDLVTRALDADGNVRDKAVLDELIKLTNEHTDRKRHCPDWCVAPHDEDATFHYEAPRGVTDIYGSHVEASLSWDERTGSLLASIGAHEIEMAQLAALEAAIAEVKRKAQTLA